MQTSPPRNRSRALRASAGAILAIVAAMLLGPVPAASAQEATIPATQSAWFWSSNSKVTTCSAGFCGAISIDDGLNASGIGATPPGALSPISTGHIAVSLKNGSSDMRGYLKFDLGSLTQSLPLGAKLKFSEFLVQLTTSLPTDTDHTEQHTTFDQGKTPGTTNQQSAGILACVATTPWGQAEGDPTASTTILPPDPAAGRTTPETISSRDEPLFDCGSQALGVASADGKSWTFDITAIANKWTSGELFNEGIALVPVDQNVAATWTVEFHGPPLTLNADGEDVEVVSKALGASATVSYEPVEVTTPPTEGPPGTPGAAGPPGQTVIPPPTGDGGDGSSPPTGNGSGIFVPVARSGSAETPGWLFALIPLGLIALRLTSNAIGLEAAPVGASNRVAQILQSRRVNGGVEHLDQSHP